MLKNVFYPKHLSRRSDYTSFCVIEGYGYSILDKSIVYTALSWNLTLNCVEKDQPKGPLQDDDLIASNSDGNINTRSI